MPLYILDDSLAMSGLPAPRSQPAGLMLHAPRRYATSAVQPPMPNMSASEVRAVCLAEKVWKESGHAGLAGKEEISTKEGHSGRALEAFSKHQLDLAPVLQIDLCVRKRSREPYGPVTYLAVAGERVVDSHTAAEQHARER
jgi:hypothetical protein